MIGVLEARGDGVSVLWSAGSNLLIVSNALWRTNHQRLGALEPRDHDVPTCCARVAGSCLPSVDNALSRTRPRPRASRPRRQRVARARATLARGGPASVIQCLLTRDRIGITSSQHKGVGRLSPAHRFHCAELLSTIGQREGDQYPMTARPTSDLCQATC